MNDSRVIPARLIGRKDTGASAEAVLIEKIDRGLWKAIVRPGNKVKKGSRLIFGSLDCEVVEHCDDSSRLLDFKGARDDEIKLVGRLAIPPYIHTYPEDPESYQTVYSKREGSIASDRRTPLQVRTARDYKREGCGNRVRNATRRNRDLQTGEKREDRRTSNARRVLHTIVRNRRRREPYKRKERESGGRRNYHGQDARKRRIQARKTGGRQRFDGHLHLPPTGSA